MRPKTFMGKVIYSIDQLVNTLLGGWPDQTISERAARAQIKGEKWACRLCKFLDKLDKDHCKNSIE